MPIWNVRAAFIEARDQYFLAQAANPDFTGAQRAQCQESANACDRAISALQGDDTWPVGQRAARYADCRDKVFAMGAIEVANGITDPHLLYGGMDLLDDAATKGNRGETTFFSSVEPV